MKSAYQRIIKNKNESANHVILVGNIKDLNGERKVSFDEAATFAHSKKMEYMEISTYNNYNCVKPFRILLKEILLCEKKLDDYFNYKNNI